MVKYFLIYLLFLFLFSSSVYAYGVGITPDKIIFKSSESIFYIYNSNEATVEYNIIGCESNDLEFNRTGNIVSNSRSQIRLSFNQAKIIDFTNCSLDISITNSMFAIGFSIPVEFDKQSIHISTEALLNHNSKITGMSVSEIGKKSNYGYIWIFILVLGLIVAIFIIWKFL